MATVERTSESSITFVATSNIDLEKHKKCGQPLEAFPRAFTDHVMYQRTFSDGNETRRLSPKPATQSTVVQTSAAPESEGCHYATRQGLIGTVVEAYNRHHNLVLDPNDIWLTVLAQFSAYINGGDRAEELRDRIVDFEGKRELVVTAGGTLFTADFGKMTVSMVDEIAKNIKDPSLREWFLPGFTTSTINDNIAAAASCMAAFQSYFSYKWCLCCGIPSVTLTGTVEDWELLQKKVQRLAEFDLKDKLMSRWLVLLTPICENFITSAKGSPELHFWDTVCSRRGGGSGPSYLCGWITTFSVFNDKGDWQGYACDPWPQIDTSDIAHNITSVPVTIDDNGAKYKSHLFAGQFAYEYADVSNTIRPRNDWCIAIEGKP